MLSSTGPNGQACIHLPWSAIRCGHGPGGDPKGLMTDNCLRTLLPGLGPQVLPGRDILAAHLPACCTVSIWYSQLIMFFCYTTMVGGQKGGRAVVVRLQNGELGPQASWGDEHQGLIPYNPQIASARNQERGGGTER